MLKIGITGQQGFIGMHLYNTLVLKSSDFELIEFQREFFADANLLDSFVLKCDVIVHLASMNRHQDPEVIYRTNISLVKNLIASLERTKSCPHILLASSSQEEKDNLYGRSKREGRELLINWASKTGAIFTGLLIPNVFGPFGKPFYNSVVATFSHQLARGETPNIQFDRELDLIYVAELVEEIINIILESRNESYYPVTYSKSARVSELLLLLEKYRDQYLCKGEIPTLENTFELNLFNTFRCYCDIKKQFPIKYTQHSDPRGSFVELIRLGLGGQVSFSTTMPGITRGNHFHTRKIERFSVIKGNALIQLRKIGSDEVLEFYLDGSEPAYVDMPIWYSHNIKNIGKELLYTNFWINEPYNSDDPDTYFAEV